MARNRANQAYNRTLKTGAIVERCGAVLVDPVATREQKNAALAEVDALGDAAASTAVRTYASTISVSAPTSPEQQALQKAIKLSAEDQEEIRRLEKYKSLINRG